MRKQTSFYLLILFLLTQAEVYAAPGDIVPDPSGRGVNPATLVPVSGLSVPVISRVDLTAPTSPELVYAPLPSADQEVGAISPSDSTIAPIGDGISLDGSSPFLPGVTIQRTPSGRIITGGSTSPKSNSPSVSRQTSSSAIIVNSAPDFSPTISTSGDTPSASANGESDLAAQIASTDVSAGVDPNVAVSGPISTDPTNRAMTNESGAEDSQGLGEYFSRTTTMNETDPDLFAAFPPLPPPTDLPPLQGIQSGDLLHAAQGDSPVQPSISDTPSGSRALPFIPLNGLPTSGQTTPSGTPRTNTSPSKNGVPQFGNDTDSNATGGSKSPRYSLSGMMGAAARAVTPGILLRSVTQPATPPITPTNSPRAKTTVDGLYHKEFTPALANESFMGNGVEFSAEAQVQYAQTLQYHDVKRSTEKLGALDVAAVAREAAMSALPSTDAKKALLTKGQNSKELGRNSAETGLMNVFIDQTDPAAPFIEKLSSTYYAGGNSFEWCGDQWLLLVLGTNGENATYIAAANLTGQNDAASQFLLVPIKALFESKSELRLKRYPVNGIVYHMLKMLQYAPADMLDGKSVLPNQDGIFVCPPLPIDPDNGLDASALYTDALNVLRWNGTQYGHRGAASESGMSEQSSRNALGNQNVWNLVVNGALISLKNLMDNSKSANLLLPNYAALPAAPISSMNHPLLIQTLTEAVLNKQFNPAAQQVDESGKPMVDSNGQPIFESKTYFNPIILQQDAGLNYVLRQIPAFTGNLDQIDPKDIADYINLNLGAFNLKEYITLADQNPKLNVTRISRGTAAYVRGLVQAVNKLLNPTI